MGIATDEISHVKQKIKEAAECDAIITSGGISSGKKDLMPSVVLELGDMRFHRVRMRPDMPMLAGVMDEKPILCMSGNVTSGRVGSADTYFCLRCSCEWRTIWRGDS